MRTRSSMKSAFTIAGAVVLLTISAAAQSAPPNFTGTWTLDASKSDFGPMPGPESIVMVVDHKEPAIKVNVTQKSQMGDATTDSNYTTDGKNNVNKMRGPAGEQDITSTTRWNGTSLTTA